MAGFDPQTGEPIPDPPATQTTATQVPPGGIVVNVPQVQAPAPVQQPSSSTLTPEMQAILDAERERVRKEEKDKLYPTIEEQRQQLEILTREREERIAAEEEAQRIAAEEEQKRREAEMSALERMQEIEQRADQRIRELEERAERERILREREMAYSEVLQYRAARLAEEADNIMPQFADYITGNTPEEVEASIERAKEKTAQVVAEVQQNQFQGRQALNMPVSGAPAVSPETLVGADQQRVFSNDDLRNMDQSEYAQIRSQLLGAAGQAVRERGLYGAP